MDQQKSYFPLNRRVVETELREVRNSLDGITQDIKDAVECFLGVLKKVFEPRIIGWKFTTETRDLYRVSLDEEFLLPLSLDSKVTIELSEDHYPLYNLLVSKTEVLKHCGLTTTGPDAFPELVSSYDVEGNIRESLLRFSLTFLTQPEKVMEDNFRWLREQTIAYIKEKGLTPRQKQLYLRYGCSCPICGHWDVVGQQVTVDMNYAGQFMYCGKCEACWTDVYRLDDIVFRE